MSVLDVDEGERGVIRVFALGAKPAEMDGAAMAEALGVSRVEMSGVEVYDMADFADLGLDGYLREGLGVAPDSVQRGSLNGIGDAVAIVHSAAFGGQAVRLDPRPPLTLAAVYQEAQGARGDLMPIESAAAQGSVAGPEAPESAETKRSALWLVLIGVAIGLIVSLLLIVLAAGA